MLRFHFVPKKNSVCVRVHCQVHPLKFMGFEPTIAVESGRAKEKTEEPNASVGLGILKVTSYKAKRETQKQKG
jgi:hypothetical protein